MSQIKTLALYLTAVVAAVVLSGCGDANTKAPFDADSGKHFKAGWVPVGHMEAAREDKAACAECHGRISAAECRGYLAPSAISAEPAQCTRSNGARKRQRSMHPT